MSELARPWPRKIADAIVVRMQRLQTDASTYATKPAYVGRIFDPDSSKAEMPCILVSIKEEAPDGALVSSDRYVSILRIEVNCITANPDSPDDEMQDMVADVKRAMLLDAQLGLNQTVESNGAGVRDCIYTGYEAISSIALGTGRAVGKVNFRVEYAWVRSEP